MILDLIVLLGQNPSFSFTNLVIDLTNAMPLNSLAEIPSFIGGYFLNMADLDHLARGFRLIMEGTLYHYQIVSEQVLERHELPVLPGQ